MLSPEILPNMQSVNPNLKIGISYQSQPSCGKNSCNLSDNTVF